ncbi:penicillin-binding protein 2 [Patescibacteria group bacterium]|nr:penicillin-binding protein 2 [Patescibacteria group bacterium]
MSPRIPWFQPIEEPSLRIETASEEEIRHEVLFEADVTSVRHRPLFVGTAFLKRRFLASFLLVFIASGLLIARAAWMQVVNSEQYVSLADNNRLRLTPLWPLRGIVRDRKGIILAENAPRFQATALPRDIPLDPETRQSMIGEAARLLGRTYGEMNALLPMTSTTPDDSVIIAGDVPYNQAILYAVALPHLTGFHLEAHPMRHYPWSTQIESLSHVLGYVGRLSPEEYEDRRGKGYLRADEIGKTGIERSYEEELRGKIGSRMNEVDARGAVKGFAGEQVPIDGQDLTLSIDVQLQELAETALKTQIERAKAKRGSVVVTDPRDGSVLALVSWPAFDNNNFAGSVSSTMYQALVRDPDQPLFPRAIAGAYPSGSTVKIAVSLAALAERVITADTSVLSVGGIHVGQWFFPDWKPGGHGVTNVRKAIAMSVNTFYYYIGGGYGDFQGLGIDRLSRWMKLFGLGSKTGVDLSGENQGFVPSKEWKESRGGHWYIGDTYNLSIGQGDLLVTPLQVNAYTSTIANKGTWFVSHVVQGPRREGGTVSANPADFETIRQGMRDGVIAGSSRALSDLPFTSAGKTGTAQWSKEKNTHAWFTAFAPFEQPEIVVTTLIEEGGEGSDFAVPVAKEILKGWWKLKTERGGTF